MATGLVAHSSNEVERQVLEIVMRKAQRLLCFLAGLFILLMPVSSYAEVEESESSLIGIAEENQMKRVEEELGFPRLDKKKVYLIASCGASYGKVVVIGSGEQAPQALAATLESWAKESNIDGEVLWSKEDEYSAARLTWSKGSFGSNAASQTIEFDTALIKLKSSGLQVFAALRVLKYVSTDLKANADSSTSSVNYYKLDETHQTRVQFNAKLGNTDYLFVILFFAFVPLITFIGFGSAIWLGNNKKIALEKRKKFYAKLVSYPTFIGIGLHAPFAIWVITGPVLRKIGDVWMGTDRATTFAFPALMLPILVLFAILPLVNKFERKLFGDGDAKPLEETVVPSHEEVALNKRKRIIAFVVIGVAITIYSLSQFVFRKQLGEVNVLFEIGSLLLIMFASNIAKLFVRTEEKALFGPESSPHIQFIADQLSQEMGTNLKPVIVSRDALLRNSIHASINPRRIMVSARAAKDLDDDEMRFLLAHELAHVRLGHLRWRFIVLFMPSVFLICVPMFLIFSGVRLFTPNLIPFVFGAMLLTMFWSAAGSKVMLRKQEYEADELALQTTMNLPAAENLLRKLVSGPNSYMHEIEDFSTHPAISNRLDRLRSLAQRLGLSSTPTSTEH